jgi:hypothetical protein
MSIKITLVHEVRYFVSQELMMTSQVVDCMVILGGATAPGRHAHAVLCTGHLELRSSPGLDAPAASAILGHLRDAVHGRNAPGAWQAAAEQVLILIYALYANMGLNRTKWDQM